jgi:hypothetical protein
MIKGIRPQDVIQQSLGLITYFLMILLCLVTFQIVNATGAIRIG